MPDIDTRRPTQAFLLTLLFLLLTLPSASAQTTQIQYLSGVDKDNPVYWNFKTNAGRNANVQTTIPVPSNWELQGFGTYTYGSAPGSPATALYNTSFTIPSSWAGQRVVLVFEGAMTDTSVKVNGTSANLILDGANGGALHQGGYYRFQYDVTSLVKTTQTNTLDVTVSEESANTSVNSAERRATTGTIAGIYRPVYLEAFPVQSIDRVAINAKADGTFNMDVYDIGLTTATSVAAQVQDLAGNAVGSAFSAAVGSGTTKVHLSTTIGSPMLWTAETPNLYQVQVQSDAGQRPFCTRSCRSSAFARWSCGAGDGFYVNGKRILLKGC